MVHQYSSVKSRRWIFTLHTAVHAEFRREHRTGTVQCIAKYCTTESNRRTNNQQLYKVQYGTPLHITILLMSRKMTRKQNHGLRRRRKLVDHGGSRWRRAPKTAAKSTHQELHVVACRLRPFQRIIFISHELYYFFHQEAARRTNQSEQYQPAKSDKRIKRRKPKGCASPKKEKIAPWSSVSNS